MISLDDTRARARRLKLMAFDVDGVLTDGSLFYTDDGVEIKAFNTLDGHGLKMLQQAGVTVAIITGRRARCVELRARNLGIGYLFQGVDNKLAVMNSLLVELGLTADVAGYMGDGATSEGDFHVALNFAGVMKAPVVLICQNNQWAISTPGHVQTAADTIALKAIGYGVEPLRVDGNDYLAIYAVARWAVERARRVRGSAAVAVSGVVAALSLAVALTVMVASFRDSVTQWLDVVLPAGLYVRTAAAGGDGAWLEPAFVQRVAQLPGVARVGTLRTQPLLLDPARPPVTLIARALDNPLAALPLVGEPLPVPAGRVGVYVSEAMVDLYDARPGTDLALLSQAFMPESRTGSAQGAMFFVAGVWRDYARQSGAITIAQADFERLTGDRRVNDLALWLAPDADAARVQDAITALARESGADGLLEFASASEIRALSLRIFDRSFAVTYWLQAVAIAIGLFGVAANFSAQVLARRKEFGLLAHLGLTRRQVLTVVAGEGMAWTLIGSLAGLALGLAVSVVLVHVVNPQSFHWSMDLAVPWLRLLALGLAVVVAGTATAWLAGRAAAGRDAVLAVKEDW